ncbi:Cof-type HAD-IIB family hydrolase [Niallia sp. Man26]|uniref:Cof-type HAD-IIB family hydrolase n=1 Tax=Niallia sp. Man26 TaxID=2912824 RepID=UPI001EDB3F18|nr:Cof-type HAD-IIB family hydrolase [Niallia sp. Man26]UPO90125.1 Cof-type HAD-IIB family hydrolase [Niallia sp. Man26]
MKLVAVDLDGTLLNYEKQVSEKNKKAIQEAYKSGIKIVIATGRSLISARDIFNNLGIDGYLIVLNGALVKEGMSNKTLFCSRLPKEALVKSLEVGYQEGATVIFNTENRNYHIPFTGNGESKQDFLKMRGDVVEMDFKKMMEILQTDTPKIMKVAFASDDSKRLKRIQRLMNEENFNPVFSDTHLIEMMDFGINKGSSLLKICQQLNIDPNDIVAFGDQENDMQMIQLAGLGIAMGNATNKLKVVADEIIGMNNESAVGEKIISLLSTQV